MATKIGSRSEPDPVRRRLLVSVHDVMPSLLGEVTEVVEFLEGHGVLPITLLVVPGAGWNGAQLDQLRRLEERGHRLAGHGWKHSVDSIRGVRHHVHSTFISRNVAEHLERDADGIARLIERCHGWFADQRLTLPELYVPPAWAMGGISRARLSRLPFRRYETLAGVYDGQRRRFRRLPLVGYEADTGFRVEFLRLWNRVNRALAGRAGVLRVGVHPDDLRLPLRDELDALLAGPAEWIGYERL